MFLVLTFVISLFPSLSRIAIAFTEYRDGSYKNNNHMWTFQCNAYTSITYMYSSKQKSTYTLFKKYET